MTEVDKLIAHSRGKATIEQLAIYVCKHMKFESREQLMSWIGILRTKYGVVVPGAVATLWHRIESIGQPEQLVDATKKRLANAIKAKEMADRDVDVAMQDLKDAEQALANHIEHINAEKKTQLTAQIETHRKTLQTLEAQLVALDDPKTDVSSEAYPEGHNPGGVYL